MDFGYLSTNLVNIIGECLNIKSLNHYIYYNSDEPLSQPSFSPALIAPKGKEERIVPLPFDVNYKDDVRSQLHIYYPDMNLVNNSMVEKTSVLFDIVVHKDLWLFTQSGKSLVRPYEMASEIIKKFSGNSVKTVGRLNFVGANHLVVNDEFHGVRLEAIMTNY